MINYYEASQQLLFSKIAYNNPRLPFENVEITYSFERYNDCDEINELKYE